MAKSSSEILKSRQRRERMAKQTDIVEQQATLASELAMSQEALANELVELLLLDQDFKDFGREILAEGARAFAQGVYMATQTAVLQRGVTVPAGTVLNSPTP